MPGGATHGAYLRTDIGTRHDRITSPYLEHEGGAGCSISIAIVCQAQFSHNARILPHLLMLSPAVAAACALVVHSAQAASLQPHHFPATYSKGPATQESSYATSCKELYGKRSSSLLLLLVPACLAHCQPHTNHCALTHSAQSQQDAVTNGT